MAYIIIGTSKTTGNEKRFTLWNADAGSPGQFGDVFDETGILLSNASFHINYTTNGFIVEDDGEMK